jgi:hypothetical protein
METSASVEPTSNPKTTGKRRVIHPPKVKDPNTVYVFHRADRGAKQKPTRWITVVYKYDPKTEVLVYGSVVLKLTGVEKWNNVTRNEHIKTARSRFEGNPVIVEKFKPSAKVFVVALDDHDRPIKDDNGCIKKIEKDESLFDFQLRIRKQLLTRGCTGSGLKKNLKTTD